MVEARDSLPPALAKLQGSTIAGAYRLDGVLGAGNMGVVFSGVQLKLKRPVAVKVLDPAVADSERSARRFQREAESVARLDHVNCLQVYDFGTTPSNLHYMVMPRLEGRPLDQLVGEGGTLSPRRALELTAQVLAGLAHAHEQGLIHRDLKPSNILVEEHGGPDGRGDVVKIVDFGIAKIVDDDASFQTRTGMLFGTPAYMSPEQALGEPIDGRSDLYSAGLVLYRLIVGDVPHRARSLVDQMRRRVTLDVPALPHPCPPSIIEVIARLCALEVDDRYVDARAARQRVLELLDGAPSEDPNWNTAIVAVAAPADASSLTLADDSNEDATEPGRAANDDVSTYDEQDAQGTDTPTHSDTWTFDDATPGALATSERTDAPVHRVQVPSVPHVESERAAPQPADGTRPSPTAVEEEAVPRAGWRTHAVVAALIGVTLGALALTVASGGVGRGRAAGEREPSEALSVAAVRTRTVAPEVEPTARATALPARDDGAAASGGTGSAEAASSVDLLRKLRLVNARADEEALPFAERHALLEELRADPGAAPLIDEEQNARLDLQQAADAKAHCGVVLEAIERLEGARDVASRRALRTAHAPSGGGPQCAKVRRALARLHRSASAPAPRSEGSNADGQASPPVGEITPKLGGLK